MITYFLLAGYTPFDRDTQQQEMEAIIAGDYKFEPEEYWANVSDTAKDFVRECLTIDPVQRPTAIELMNHPWMLDFREKLRSYEEEASVEASTTAAAASTAPADAPAFEGASVARQAAILQEQESELIRAVSPSLSPLATPEGSSDSSSPGLQAIVGAGGAGPFDSSPSSSGGSSSAGSNSS